VSAEPAAASAAFAPLYTAAEMRAAEEAYPGYPETVDELMDVAGSAVAEHALRAFPDARSFTVVCGAGSNGGDGRIAAVRLREAGRAVKVVHIRPEEAPKTLGRPDVVVDALFGTGFRGAPREAAARLIADVNALGVPVVAVDVPSGVDASTGEATGEAVHASLTVTFHAAKVGLHVAPGRFHAGEIVVADIGLDARATAHRRVLPPVLGLPPARRPTDTKYSAGTVLVVGGSRGLSGAVCLTAAAAFRADAGYVAVAAPASLLPVVEATLLEAVKHPLPEDEEGRLAPAALEPILARAERAHAVALGPGLGRGDGVRVLVRDLLERLDRPVVVDADALFGLEPVERRAPTVLTPHAGELARLLGEDPPSIEARRLDAVRRAADRFAAVVLLKGPDTLVAEPGGGTFVCDLGPPSLATAGTGDVLTGVLAAFLAKGLPPGEAAAAASAAQQLAAGLVPEQRGLVAGDVVAALPRALAAAAL
jgi:ADP-dependent NAD(P)H-hydrate dehydratase / NAD(P)H-hydrate epimerase